MSDIPGLQAAAARVETLNGTVVSVNVSDGGVPKHPVVRAAVAADGMAGDRQRDLRHHGGETRALCLYSADLIDALRAEGHPIAPGFAGENLTLAGIPWEAMTVGAHIRIGDLEAEVTGYATPCGNLEPYFSGGRFVRISQKVHPGWSRVYARVLREGTVVFGDVAHIWFVPSA